jgi:hypothetical protein
MGVGFVQDCYHAADIYYVFVRTYGAGHYHGDEPIEHSRGAGSSNRSLS